jgi:hypothetical protein
VRYRRVITIAERLRLREVATLDKDDCAALLFSGGQVVRQVTGARSKPAMLAEFADFI